MKRERCEGHSFETLGGSGARIRAAGFVLAAFASFASASFSEGASGTTAATASPRGTRVWVIDGKDTYLAISPLLALHDAVLVIEPDDLRSWNQILGDIRAFYADGTAQASIVAVGPLPSEVVAGLLNFQNEGRAGVLVEPDPWRLMQSVINATDAPIAAIWVKPESLGIACYAGSIRPVREGLVIPTADAERLNWLVSTGKTKRVIAEGRDAPASVNEAADKIHVTHLGNWMELVAWGRGEGDGPPPPGTVANNVTLAFYSGKEYKDRAFDPGYNGPNKCPQPPFGGAPIPCPLPPKCTETQLSFYDSTTVALELSRGRNDFVPCGLIPDLQNSPYFNPYGQDPTHPEGWGRFNPNSTDIEQAVKNSIPIVVNNLMQFYGIQVTKLAIVSHPMDIPYRRFIFPWLPCDAAKNVVDNLSTDNNEDGACNGTIITDIFGNQVFDGSTPPADFEFANITPETGPEKAELAYGRVGGDRLAVAMAHVAASRYRLVPPFPTGFPKGAAIVGGPYAQVQSVFDQVYSTATLTNCKQGAPGPTCPGNQANPCVSMTYDIDTDFVQPAARSNDNREINVSWGHQDELPEPTTYPFGPPNGPGPAHFCGGAGEPPCARVSVTDHQRAQFPKFVDPNCSRTPDLGAPFFSSEVLRASQENLNPADDRPLASGIWFMEGSLMANFNYRNHPQNVRNCAVGSDSSFMSTILGGGAAGYVAQVEIRSNPNVCTGTLPFQLYWRELALGSTLGDAARRIGNFQSQVQCPFASRFSANTFVMGDPSLRLNLQGSLGPQNVTILAAPGPGAGNIPRVRGYDETGLFFGLPDFVAYSYNSFGCNVAAAQVDVGTNDEILTGAGYSPTYGPHVKGFQRDGRPYPGINFFAFATVGYGVNVSRFNYRDQTTDQILATPGPGAVFGPQVRGFEYGIDPNTKNLTMLPITKVNFFAFPAADGYGANAIGANCITGMPDIDEILVGQGAGPLLGPNARLFKIDSAGFPAQIDSGIVSILPGTYGVNVGAGNVDGALYQDLIFGAGPGNMNNTGLVVLPGDGGFSPISNGIPIVNQPNVFATTDFYGVRVGAADLDGDLDDEVLATRGWDPTRQAGFENSKVVALNYDPNSSTGVTQTLSFHVNTPGVNDTIAGLSIAGGKLSIPSLPAAAEPPPISALVSIDGILRTVEPGVFVQEGSRPILLDACAGVGTALSAGDYFGALGALEMLTTRIHQEVSHEFVRDALLSAIEVLAGQINMAASDQPPVAVIEGPTSFCPGLALTFSGISSSDPDERGLSRSDIQNYGWSVDGQVQDAGQELALLRIPTPGHHVVGLKVTDTFGLTGETSFGVEVGDGVPPDAQATAAPSSLWPPNHQMVPIHVTLNITDACDDAPTFKLLSVTSNEPETGCGSGNHAPDIQRADIGTPDVDFSVRAERCGSGSGRTYTAVYEVRDSSGNTRQVQATIVVPHNQ